MTSALFRAIECARIERDAADVSLEHAAEEAGRMLAALTLGDWTLVMLHDARCRRAVRDAERFTILAELILQAAGLPLDGKSRRTFARDEAGVIREASTVPPAEGL